MTKEELSTLQDWVATLSGDELQGALDALRTVQQARMDSGGGVGGSPIPPEIEIDPELDRPEMRDTPEMPPDDLDIEDPDEVLKKKAESSKDDADKGTDDKKSDGDSDGDTKKDADAEKDSDGDKVDDVDDAVPDTLYKDQAEEEAKKSEVFRRKVELSAARSQIKRALRKIDSGETEATDEQKQKLQELDEKAAAQQQELKDNPDSVKDTSAADFNDFINEILDLADSLGVRHTKITDMESRVKKIKDSTEDALAASDLEDEDAANLQKDPEFQKMKAREREKDRLRKALDADTYTSAFAGSMADFKRDLKKAISNQIDAAIEEVEEETYARVNRWHEDDDMVLPGIRIDELPKGKRPSIDVYFDQSGSWGTGEVKRGMAAIADLLELEKQNLLDLKIYYFSEILSQDQSAARLKGRMECWDYVIENINAAPKTKNVIIMTDNDISYNYNRPGCHGCVEGPGTTVSGCVWFLWKGGSRAASASKKLHGQKGTFEYSV